MPSRGEVWIVDLGLAQKSRPALIVSTEYGDEDRALITVVPHTTALRNSVHEVEVQTSFLARGGAFLVQGLTAIPRAHAVRRLGVLTDMQMAAVEKQMRLWLGL